MEKDLLELCDAISQLQKQINKFKRRVLGSPNLPYNLNYHLVSLGVTNEKVIDFYKSHGPFKINVLLSEFSIDHQASRKMARILMALGFQNKVFTINRKSTRLWVKIDNLS